MGNFLWVKTKHREQLLKDIENIPEYGKKSKSELLEIALEEFIKKHGSSQNPQTKISLYQTGLEHALPNLYEIIDDPIKLDRFYKAIKTKEEYRRIDEAINILVNKHNKKLGDFY